MIKTKKTEIIEDVLSKFEVKHKGVHTETQHFKCVRDTGYNFDAIVADLKAGGINFEAIPCLNDNKDHIQLFKYLINKRL